MAYTDKFFEFPVRVYDGRELMAKMKKEESIIDAGGEIPIEDSSWVQGLCAILPEDIVGYSESFSIEKNVDAIMKDGVGNLTHIDLRHDRSEVCMWDVKKFKARLNKFMEEKSNDSIKQ